MDLSSFTQDQYKANKACARTLSARLNFNNEKNEKEWAACASKLSPRERFAV
jgi:hypothetical protein